MKYINQINIILMGAAVAFCLWVAAQTFLTEPQNFSVASAQGAAGAGGGAASDIVLPDSALPEGEGGAVRPAAGSSGVVPGAAGARGQNVDQGSQARPGGSRFGSPRDNGRDAFQGSGNSPQGASPQAAPQRRNPLAAPGSGTDGRANVGRPAGTRGMTRTPPPIGARGSAKRGTQRDPNAPAPRGSMRRNNDN